MFVLCFASLNIRCVFIIGVLTFFFVLMFSLLVLSVSFDLFLLYFSYLFWVEGSTGHQTHGLSAC
jgi:hypothetical protein